MPSKKQTSLSTKRAQALKVAERSRLAHQAKLRTKKQQLIDLLTGEKPVTAEKVSKTLGWQLHTVRAAITGLRKAGFAVDTAKPSDGGGTYYRIIGHLQTADASAR